MLFVFLVFRRAVAVAAHQTDQCSAVVVQCIPENNDNNSETGYRNRTGNVVYWNWQMAIINRLRGPPWCCFELLQIIDRRASA